VTYRIRGLDPDQFAKFFAMTDEQLVSHRAVRAVADADRGFPCRVSLRDATCGDELVLVHHTNHAVETPYRNSFAIFVRRDATEAAEYVDCCPPVFEGRPIALRGYDADGNLRDARLTMAGEADAGIRSLLDDPGVDYIDAHNAAHGCFAARVTRYD